MGYDSLEDIKVSNYLVRYIVPFSYDSKTDADDYTYAFQKLMEAKWELKENDKAESECYEYLKTIYTVAEDKKDNPNTIGSLWKMPQKKKEKMLVSCWREKTGQENVKKKEREQEVILKGMVSEAGLYLLKNKIGLFWYEVEFAKGEISLDSLVEFQNRFKELSSHGDGTQIRLTGEICVGQRDVISDPDAADFYNVEIVGRKEFRKRKPKTTEETEKKSFKTPYRISKEAVIKALRVVGSEEQIKSIKLKEAEEVIRDGNTLRLMYDIVLSSGKMGIWIQETLSALDCEVHYYPECKHQNTVNIPDKALLFNYIAVDEAELKKEGKENGLKYAAYYLTKGFKKSYKPSPDFEAEMQYPFENIIWNAQREGCGIYLSFSEENKGFLADNSKRKRVANDYFHLYMSLLQQSYVLLRFSEEIATTISANKSDYRSRESRIGEKLEDLQLRINLFLMKNIYASVGFTNHHNQFYAYIEKTLNIKEDIDALNSGVSVLDELLRRREEEQRTREKEQEEESSDRMQKALAVLSILSVLSLPKTLTELFGIDIIDCVNLEGPYTGILLFIFYVATIILFVILIKASLPVLKKLFTKSHKKNVER